ncbi:MAG TPA: hypothetical protein VMF51_06505 [Nocardioides sp.]|uniref:hypothetical protein n=1 Tax=Nocardioides sp. TaxID=35761 RepID=UPI002C3C7721|nr:hypothetical protein [Nocardioides sp.]HTW14761.1 hypothetical protein [Nocardioides sp.]
MTWYLRLSSATQRFRTPILVGVGASALLAGVAAVFIDPVDDFLKGSNVVPYLCLLLLIDLALAERSRLADEVVDVSINQDEAMPKLMQIAQTLRHEQVDLLEYAGQTTLPLMRCVARQELPVRILIKHPETVAPMQRQRTISTLDTLYTSVFDKYSAGFEVRCYRGPFTLRGRRLGHRVLELGWLTTDRDRQTAYGHDNPSMLHDIRRPDTLHLTKFFDKTFTDLWDAPDTEDGAAVLARHHQTTS